MNKVFVDARNLLCPMPVIRVQDKVKQLQMGDVLEVVCTDPGVMQDIPAWCRINGHQIDTSEYRGSEYFITLTVGVE